MVLELVSSSLLRAKTMSIINCDMDPVMCNPYMTHSINYTCIMKDTDGTATCTVNYTLTYEPGEPRRHFGVPLQYLCYNGDILGVPAALALCCSKILRDSRALEGIFRINVRLDAVEDIKKVMELQLPADLMAVTMKTSDMVIDMDISDMFPNNEYGGHHAAAILKSFLRDMPEPLITYEKYDCFVSVVAGQDSDTPDVKSRKPKEIILSDKQIIELKRLLYTLPPHNLLVIAVLMKLLNIIAFNQDKTKMGYNALAIVIAPNIMRSMISNSNPMIAMEEGHKTTR